WAKRQKGRARHGELELLVAPVQQQDAEFFLQRGDAAGHGRLREVELVGGAGDAFERGHPVKGFNKTQVHGGAPRSRKQVGAVFRGMPDELARDLRLSYYY